MTLPHDVDLLALYSPGGVSHCVNTSAYLNTRELASRAGIAPDTILRIESGDYKKLRPSTMRKIAEALGVHPAEIAEFAPVDSETGSN